MRPNADYRASVRERGALKSSVYHYPQAQLLPTPVLHTSFPKTRPKALEDARIEMRAVAVVLGLARARALLTRGSHKRVCEIKVYHARQTGSRTAAAAAAAGSIAT